MLCSNFNGFLLWTQFLFNQWSDFKDYLFVHLLQEVEDFITQEFSTVAEKWKFQDKIGWHKFTLAEPVFAQRMTLMKLNPNLDQVWYSASVYITNIVSII